MLDTIFSLLPLLNKYLSKKKNKSTNKKPTKNNEPKEKNPIQNFFEKINELNKEVETSSPTHKEQTPTKKTKPKINTESSLAGIKLFLLHLIWYQSENNDFIKANRIFSTEYLSDINYRDLYQQLKMLEKLGYVKTSGSIPKKTVKISKTGLDEIKNYVDIEDETKSKEDKVLELIEEVINSGDINPKIRGFYNSLLKDIEQN